MSNKVSLHEDYDVGKFEASQLILGAACRAAEANRLLLRACSVLLSHRDCIRLRKIGCSFQGVVEPLTRVARAIEREAEAVSDAQRQSPTGDIAAEGRLL